MSGACLTGRRGSSHPSAARSLGRKSTRCAPMPAGPDGLHGPSESAAWHAVPDDRGAAGQAAPLHAVPDGTGWSIRSHPKAVPIPQGPTGLAGGAHAQQPMRGPAAPPGGLRAEPAAPRPGTAGRPGRAARRAGPGRPGSGRIRVTSSDRVPGPAQTPGPRAGPVTGMCQDDTHTAPRRHGTARHGAARPVEAAAAASRRVVPGGGGGRGGESRHPSRGVTVIATRTGAIRSAPVGGGQERAWESARCR
jgi:hypothetical protein